MPSFYMLARWWARRKTKPIPVISVCTPATIPAKEMFLHRLHDGISAGAYALIFSPDGEILTIEANGGRRYLPGGRLEQGEGPEDALLREVLEECGCEVEILTKIGEADQRVEGGRHSIRAHYFEAVLAEAVRRGEHATVWMRPDEAARSMHRRSDARAIEQALLRKKREAGAERERSCL